MDIKFPYSFHSKLRASHILLQGTKKYFPFSSSKERKAGLMGRGYDTKQGLRVAYLGQQLEVKDGVHDPRGRSRLLGLQIQEQMVEGSDLLHDIFLHFV